MQVLDSDPELEVNQMVWETNGVRRMNRGRKKRKKEDKENVANFASEVEKKENELPSMERNSEFKGNDRKNQLVGIIEFQEETSEKNEDTAPKKKLTKKQREKLEIKFIEDYRQKMLMQANQECDMYKERCKMDEEVPRQRRISFNQKKEILEYNKQITTPRRLSKDKEKPPKNYEIRSALKGSQEVYSGQISGQRKTYLGPRFSLFHDDISEASANQEMTIHAKMRPEDFPLNSPYLSQNQDHFPE